jgi:hypothetical protein
MDEIYHKITYGDRIKNWRDNRDVTSKTLYLDKYTINKIVCERLVEEGIIPKDYEDRHKYDFWSKEEVESRCSCSSSYYGTCFMWYVDTESIKNEPK